ncbi:MAG: flagellar biosynthetic protein FliO [Candidatus Hydrogenedens sp.]
MKNRKNFFSVVFFLFLLFYGVYIFAENNSSSGNDSVLDKLKDPKQYVEKNNEGGAMSTKNTEAVPEKENNPSNTNTWFSQHQKVWSSEQTTTGNTEGENVSSNSSNTTETSWIYYFFRTLVALIFVIGLILVLLGVLRYFSNKTHRGMKSIGKIVGVLYLSPRTRIYYVQGAGKVFVLGVSGDQMNLLFVFSEDEFFASIANEDSTESSYSQKTFKKVLDDVETRIQSQSSSKMPEVSENIDDELASLKVNIQRLQQAIREETNNASDQ